MQSTRPIGLSLVVCLALVTSVIPVSPALSRDQAGCDVHAPIHVLGDRGPLGFILGHDAETGEPIYRPGSGVVDGTGTAGDPYVIEGWCIEPAPLWTGVLLEDTTAHVVIRDNQIDGQGVQDTGLALEGAENVQVTNNVIQRNRGDGIAVSGVRGMVVTNNTIETNGDTGIDLSGSDRPLVANNTLLNNEDASIAARETVDVVVRDNSIWGHDGRWGISIVDTTGATVQNNTIQSLSVSALYIAGSDQTLAENNTITDGGSGAYLSRSDTVLLANNTITHSYQALRNYRSTAVVAEYNEMEANDDGIVFIESADGVLEANEITGSDWTGVVLSWTVGTHVGNNTIVDSARYGISTAGPEGVTIHENVLHGNEIAALKTMYPGLVHAEGNWWGDASGPSGGVTDACTGTVAEGDGGQIEVRNGGTVCFDPWLSAPPTP